MADGRKRFSQSFQTLLAEKLDKPKLYPAMLGAYVDGVKQVKVAKRMDFVYCRMRGSTSEVVQAFNDAVGIHWDLPILIYRDELVPNRWKVYGRDISQYDDWGGASYLPPHGDAHSFAGGKTGSDVVWVFKRQYMPLLPRPSASGTMSIYIEPDFWYYGGSYYWWPGSGTADLTPYGPTGITNGRFVTIYMDGQKKIPQYIRGPEFSPWNPPTDYGPFIPLPTSAQGVPIAAVYLGSGTSFIGWGEIYDLRNIQQPMAGAGSTGTSFGAYDEGISQGQFSNLNIVGTDIELTVSGTFATIKHTPSGGGGGGSGTIYYTEDGIAILSSGTSYRVPGNSYATGSLTAFLNGLVQRKGIDYSESIPNVGEFQFLSPIPTGSYATVQYAKPIWGGAVSAQQPITGSVVVEDEGVLLGSVTALNFVGEGVVASISGSVAQIIIRMLYPEDGIAVFSSGTSYFVPDPPYSTGTLSVFANGLAQRKGIDFVESIPTSGEFRFLSTVPTGSYITAQYAKLT